MTQADYLLPWERQPEESDPAWAAFLVFRDLPYTPYRDEDGREQPGRPRSQREAARRVEKARSLIDKWAVRHAWQTRARAMDADLDRDRRAKLKHQALAAVVQHGQLAGMAVRAVAMPLSALAKPQLMTDNEGNVLVNEDGNPITRDRQHDLERMATPGLLLLMRQVASVLPAVIQVRMEALGNPHEPLPEVPEFGAAPEETETTTPDRMAELLAAMDESGLLRAAGMTPADEQAAVEEAEALTNGAAE